MSDYREAVRCSEGRPISVQDREEGYNGEPSEALDEMKRVCELREWAGWKLYEILFENGHWSLYFEKPIYPTEEEQRKATEWLEDFDRKYAQEYIDLTKEFQDD